MPTWPTVTAEAALGVDPSGDYLVLGDATRGVLGTGRLGPDGGIWTNLSSRLLGFTYFRGRKRRFAPFERTTITARFKNFDGDLDPNNLSGTYVQAGVTQLQPMKRFRITAALGSSNYPLVAGYSDDWHQDYENPFGPICVLHASGLSKVLARIDRAESPAAGGGELSGARMHRLFDHAGIPAGDRDFDAGETTVQPTTLSQNVATEAILTADTELGELREGNTGKAEFRGRHSRLEATRSIESQATWGNGSGEIPFSDIDPRFNDELVENTVSIARTGGTAQVASDETSQARYLDRDHRRTDLLMETDAEALAMAQWRLYLNKDADQRFDWAKFQPVVTDAQIGEVLARDIGDRVTVKHRPRGLASVVERDCFVEGIEVEHRAPHWWQATFWLSDAERLSGFMILGHATLGKLGTGKLAGY